MNIKQKGIYLIGTVFVSIGILSGCGSNGAAPSQDKEAEPEEQKQQEVEEETTDEAKKQPTSKQIENDKIIEISAIEMGYTPSSITLEEGIEYTLVLKNDGEIFHDLTAEKLNVEVTYMGEMPGHPEGMASIDEIFNVKKVYASGNHDGGHHEKKMNYIHMNAESGQTVKIKFIPKETGEFRFYCTVPGHEEAGMHGNLEVGS